MAGSGLVRLGMLYFEKVQLFIAEHVALFLSFRMVYSTWEGKLLWDFGLNGMRVGWMGWMEEWEEWKGTGKRRCVNRWK